MTEAHIQYWEECLSEAAHDCNLEISDAQLKCLAEAADNGHENYSMMFPSGPPDPLVGEKTEIQRLQDELQKERDKVTCRVCNGSGQEISHGPIHSSYSQCWKCNGNGRVSL